MVELHQAALGGKRSYDDALGDPYLHPNVT